MGAGCENVEEDREAPGSYPENSRSKEVTPVLALRMNSNRKATPSGLGVHASHRGWPRCWADGVQWHLQLLEAERKQEAESTENLHRRSRRDLPLPPRLVQWSRPF